jgi:hypothetical protein
LPTELRNLPLIADKVFHHLAKTFEYIFGPNDEACQKVPLVPYDTAAADRLLAADGWLPGLDGVR